MNIRIKVNTFLIIVLMWEKLHYFYYDYLIYFNIHRKNAIIIIYYLQIIYSHLFIKSN
jgi:hypothetical protein